MGLPALTEDEEEVDEEDLRAFLEGLPLDKEKRPEAYAVWARTRLGRQEVHVSIETMIGWINIPKDT